MRKSWLAGALIVALLLAGMALAESFGATPEMNVALGRGESLKLDTSSILVSGGKALKFLSSDAEIASVDGNGVVTGHKRGGCSVGVGYDNTLLGVYRVSVTAAPKRVRLSEDMAILSVGDTLTLKAALNKDSASALAFTSGKPSVAKVDAAGVVTALSAGKATVTVSTYNGKTDSCDIYVLGGKAPSTLSLNVSSLVLQKGESFRLEAAVDPGSDAFYRYASMNKKIAQVSDEGVITGIRAGSTVVAVRTHNGLTQTVSVTVKSKLKDVYGCLTKDPKTFVEIARKLKLVRDTSVSQSDGVVGRNGELTLAMSKKGCQVALSAVDDPRFCVQGVDVSMTPEAAAAKLLAGGWALTASKNSDGVEQRVFTKGGDTTHRIIIATGNGVLISGIAAQWEW